MAAECCFQALNTEYWAEWVESEANASDPFSRFGLLEDFVRQLRSLEVVPAVSEAAFIWQQILGKKWSAIWHHFRALARGRAGD